MNFLKRLRKGNIVEAEQTEREREFHAKVVAKENDLEAEFVCRGAHTSWMCVKVYLIRKITSVREIGRTVGHACNVERNNDNCSDGQPV